MHWESFPNATPESLKVTSPASIDYNCIAWTFRDTTTWWSTAPGYYWPPRTPRPMSRIESVIELYRRHGFETCDSADLEDGFEKIALYTSSGRFEHAALQLSGGRWTSKLGTHEDVEHDTLETLLGGEFESVACVLRRRRQG